MPVTFIGHFEYVDDISKVFQHLSKNNPMIAVATIPTL